MLLLAALLPNLAQAATKPAQLPVDISADSLEIRQQTGIAQFQKNVVVTHGGMILKADMLEAHYVGSGVKQDELSGNIDYVQASGNLQINLKDGETVTADKATYKPASKLLILSDNVVLTRGGSSLRGSSLTYDLAGGIANLKSDLKQGVSATLRAE